MIKRHISKLINRTLGDRKVVIIAGPRQAGKTTLLSVLEEYLPKPIIRFNGDEVDTRTRLANPSVNSLTSDLTGAKAVVIDEAQRIENIGLTLKLLTDNLPIKVLASGSSAFELANRINEPLTGRKWEYQLLPISYGEMVAHTSPLEEHQQLTQRLVFGYYPEVVTSAGREIPLLRELAGSYLYKDILTWERINKPERLEKLAQALAFQVGQEVSYTELGQLCGLDNETVERYLLLLERAYIVYRLTTFSRNLRNELKKTRKVYFYDNGLRNALINQFAPLNLRSDVGALWENFLMTERLKYLNNSGQYANRFFWRTHAQQEIDYIEESDGELHAYEFKWNPQGRKKFPKSFLQAYPHAKTDVVTPENVTTFLGL
jgi:hypothetical protein